MISEKIQRMKQGGVARRLQQSVPGGQARASILRPEVRACSPWVCIRLKRFRFPKLQTADEIAKPHPRLPTLLARRMFYNPDVPCFGASGMTALQISDPELGPGFGFVVAGRSASSSNPAICSMTERQMPSRESSMAWFAAPSGADDLSSISRS